MSSAYLSPSVVGYNKLIISHKCTLTAKKVRPHLECWIHLWAPQHKRHMYALEWVQWKAAKVTEGFEQPSYEEMLRAKTVQPGEGKSLGILSMCINTLWEWVKKSWTDCSQAIDSVHLWDFAVIFSWTCWFRANSYGIIIRMSCWKLVSCFN